LVRRVEVGGCGFGGIVWTIMRLVEQGLGVAGKLAIVAARC
jgi:hypothetical protein